MFQHQAFLHIVSHIVLFELFWAQHASGGGEHNMDSIHKGHVHFQSEDSAGI